MTRARFAVVVAGAAGVDVLAAPAGPLAPRLSNPGRVQLAAGGAGRNVACNLARLGASVRLLAAVAEGPLGDWVLEQTQAAGVQTSAVLRTAQGNLYVAIVEGGRTVWAVSEMAGTEAIVPQHLDPHAQVLRQADAVVLDANLAPETIRHAAALAAGPRLCLLPVSAAKAERMVPVLDRAALVVLGGPEAAALTGRMVDGVDDALQAAQALRARSGAEVVVTLGADGIGWIGEGSEWYRPPPAQVVDPTGAGDAVAAVAVYGLLAGWPRPEVLRLAHAAAAMTAADFGATHPGLSLEAVAAHAGLAARH